MDTVTIKKRLEFHTQRLDKLYLGPTTSCFPAA